MLFLSDSPRRRFLEDTSRWSGGWKKEDGQVARRFKSGSKKALQEDALGRHFKSRKTLQEGTLGRHFKSKRTSRRLGSLEFERVNVRLCEV